MVMNEIKIHGKIKLTTKYSVLRTRCISNMTNGYLSTQHSYFNILEYDRTPKISMLKFDMSVFFWCQGVRIKKIKYAVLVNGFIQKNLSLPSEM